MTAVARCARCPTRGTAFAVRVSGQTMSTAVANTSIDVTDDGGLQNVQGGASLSSGTGNLRHVQDAR